MKKDSFYPIAFASHGANDLYWFILPLVLPHLLKRFSLLYSGGGAILTGYMLVVAAFSFVLGRFSDKIVRWKLLSVGFLLASSGFLAISFQGRLWLFVSLLFITGIGVSTFHPVMYAMLDEKTIKNRGRIFGYYEMWGTVAILAMYLVTGLLFDVIGWQGALMLAAGPGFAMVLVFFLFRGVFKDIDGAKHEAAEEYKADVKKRPLSLLVIFLLSAMLRVLSAMAVLNFIPTYFSLGLNLPPAISSYVSGIVFLGGIAAGFTIGRACDKIGPFLVMLFFAGGVGVLILLISLVTVSWLLPLITFLFGFVMSSCVPSQNLILVSLTNRSGKGESFGILMSALTITSAVSPFLLGLLADALGLAKAIRIFSIPAFLGWIIYCLLYLRLRRMGLIHTGQAVRD